MCLIVKDKDYIRAAKDICCYKLVVRYCSCNCYMTPIQKYPLPSSLKNYEQEDFDDVSSYKLYSKTLDRYRYFITKGVIHSFAKLKDARYLKSYAFCNTKCTKFEIWKCIIPEGTMYYKGITESSKDGYASKKLKYLRKVY
jgi:hypothetical protein